MKFSFIDGQRREAQPGLSGVCPVCEATTIAKCGEKNIWHWAHKGRRICDRWWENETDWHRGWKNHFSGEWQEVVRWADDGEKHVADVKTDQDWVIEFQHSHIKLEERRSREAFYGNMVWIIDGLRRKNDLKKFIEVVRDGYRISQAPLIVRVHPLEGRLLEEWSTSRVPVLFDFGDDKQPRGLWLLIPMGLDDTAYITLVGKEDFISWNRKGDFNPQPFIDLVKTLEKEMQRRNELYYPSHSLPLRMPRRPRRRL